MIKIFRFLKPYWVMVVMAVVFIFAQTMFDLKLPQLMSEIIDKGVMKHDTDQIYKSGLIMLGFTLMSAVAAIVVAYLMNLAAAGFGRDIRKSVFTKTLNYSRDEFNKIGTASLITRSTNDITQVQQFVVMSRMMIAAPIMAIGGVIMAVSEAPSLTWLLVTVIGIMLLIILVMYFVVVPLFKSVQKKIDKLNLVLREALTGVRVIRAFNRLKQEEETFEVANKDLTSTYLKINRIMSLMMPIMMFVMSCTSLAIVYFGAHQIQDSNLEIGGMMAFIQYVMQVVMSVMMVTMIFIFLPRAAVSAGRLNEVLDTKNEIVETSNPVSPKTQTNVLEFRDVTFRFKGAEAPVLKNISFTSKIGQTTAIIGGTGSGKSTLIELIPRFYDIESGSILIDGADVKNMAQHELRKRIGLVTQNAVIFSGTIKDNIKFGSENVTESDILHASEVAQATEFISEMEDKFDSEIAQGGTNISGGQKQRLSIARALLKKPEIYIFDDSFSALDFKTDAKLRAALKGETKNSTVLVVAQRVSTIMDADQILVLNDGELVAKGTHKELYQTSEVYKEIVLSQLAEEELA